jgi:hypothetical protein
MSTMSAFCTAKSDSGFVSLLDRPRDSLREPIIRMGSSYILPLDRYLAVPNNSPHADHQELPKAFSGANMRDLDRALSRHTEQRAVPLLPTAPGVGADSVKQESDHEASGPDSEIERTRRQALERRMPPRAGIQAKINRRKARGLPDPWLDDKYDWEPKD